MSEYFIGLDLGKMSDYTAIAVLRRDPVLDENGKIVSGGSRYQPYNFTCGHLDRLPLGTSYPSVVRNVKELVKRPEFGPNPQLVVDASGVGGPVVDMFHDAGLNPIALTITGGSSVTSVAGGWHVAKIELISAAQAVLSSGRLKITRGLAHGETLRQELADYHGRTTAAANEVFEARSGSHDDLVLSVAMCVWLGGYLYYSAGAW